MMQHAEFGLSTLPFLSYEAVFLYLLLCDAGLCFGPPDGTPTCCRGRTSRRVHNDSDSKSARFAAAFGVLLGLIKFDDDVRDSGSVMSRLLRWRFEKCRALMETLLGQFDSQFTDRVADVLARHAELEQRQSCELEEFVRPTADGFGYLFRMAAVAHDADESTIAWFEKIGSHVGSAIVAFDCAADWYFDRNRGQTNPLNDESCIEPALDLAFLNLAQAAWLCESNFDDSSVTATVLRSALNRLSAFAPGRPIEPGLKSWLLRNGFTREPGYTYATCDCCEVFTCCDAIGEAGACCDGAGTCCSSGAEVSTAGSVCEGGCCVLDCCNCGPGDSCCGESHEEINSRQEKVVGQTGVVVRKLSPAGLVRINKQRFRAHSESGTIPVGQHVLAVESRSFGLIVRAVAPGKTPE